MNISGETIQCSSFCAGNEIKCNETNSDTECEINCAEQGSCSGSVIYCAPNKHCTILCTEPSACYNSIIHCPNNMDNNDGDNHHCNIIGTQAMSLNNMKFNCYDSFCNVTCNGIGSCLNSTINGNYQNSNVRVECKDDAFTQGTTEQNFACKNIKVYARPSDGNNKYFKIKSITITNIPHYDLQFYAINSWNDFDLTEYRANILPSSKMFCSEGFTDSCSINNVSANNDFEWNCINKSNACWVDYGQNNDDDDTDYGLIIGLSVGAFFLLIIALCIGLYLKKDEEAFAEKYDNQVIKNNKRWHKEKEKEKEKEKGKGIDVNKGRERALMKEELDDLKGPHSTSQGGDDYNSFEHERNETVTDIDEDDESEDFKNYKKMLQMTFYTFAGYQPYAKKRGLYLRKNELQKFLDIVNIHDDVDEVLALIDSVDVQDGKVTFNEWMDYFTSKTVNPSIFIIKHHIEEQVTWKLLCKALKIFEKIDHDHTG